MISRSQQFRTVTIGTTLEPDALLVRSVSGWERLSEGFEYELDLRSENPAIPLHTLTGAPLKLSIELPNDRQRCIHGHVRRFTAAGPVGRLTRYVATIVPWTWFLSRRTNCRIFQNKSVLQIIKEIFEEYGPAAYDFQHLRKYPPREYCVQYRESDLDFVNRLLEKEGLTTFFRHDDDRHTLIITDSPTGHHAENALTTLPYRPGELVNADSDVIASWASERRVLTSAVTLDDFDFMKPRTSLRAGTIGPREDGLPPLERFDYPGGYTVPRQGEEYTRDAVEQLEAEEYEYRGETNARGLACGSELKLTNHPDEAQNRSYLITGTEIEINSDDHDAAGRLPGQPLMLTRFRAIEAKRPYRPAMRTPTPRVHGPQTAIVVGPANEEIYTDEWGRVKVKFHWDRYARGDENSSCFVRVSQLWAGRGWGAMFLPRIGQEVIVEFLEGEPDRPIITGRVYNRDNPVPYPLPAHKTISCIKSDSTKGSGGFNEIKFEDKKGEELFYEQAEKDRQVLVKNNNSENVGANESLSVGGNRSKSVVKNEQVSIGENYQAQIGQNSATSVGDHMVVNVGKTLVFQAGTSITLKCGLSTIHMNQAGIITISGTIVTMAGMVNCNVAAPLTNMSGLVTLVNGAITRMDGALLAHMGSPTKASVDGGETVIKGGPIKLN